MAQHCQHGARLTSVEQVPFDTHLDVGQGWFPSVLPLEVLRKSIVHQPELHRFGDRQAKQGVGNEPIPLRLHKIRLFDKDSTFVLQHPQRDNGSAFRLIGAVGDDFLGLRLD